jgi:hypothetical protein
LVAHPAATWWRFTAKHAKFAKDFLVFLGDLGGLRGECF